MFLQEQISLTHDSGSEFKIFRSEDQGLGFGVGRGRSKRLFISLIFLMKVQIKTCPFAETFNCL